MEKDTIVANATPLTASAVSIIRISGKDALNIGKSIFSKKEDIKPRKAYFGKFIDENGEIIDEGLFLYFKAPKSFTGEDVVEIQVHGSVPVVKKIIKEAIKKGARFAQPGEFTKRAFLNGKIDLTQAEAIAQLIEAKSEKASKAAVNLLEGKLSKEIKFLKEKLININMLIEAELNFPEDVEEIDETVIKKDLKEVIDKIKQLLSTYKKGKLIREGIKLAIVGRPNVGKSSLFNSLMGYERAIVSDIQGTTRDFIEESFTLNGIPVRLIDTAGIREAKDEIEKIGIQKTKEKIEEADIILFVFDVSKGLTEEDLKIYEEVKYKKPIVVGNKSDLILDKNQKKYYFKDIIYTSVKTKEGINQLEEEILKELYLTEESDTEIYINLRHQEILEKALNILNKIYKNFENYLNFKEILMLEIREAENYLSEIIGEISTEDVLGKIFSSFCIGK